MQRCSVMVSSGIGNNSSVLARPLRGGHCALWASNVPFVVWSRSKICPLPALCPLITSSNQLNYLTRASMPILLTSATSTNAELIDNFFIELNVTANDPLSPTQEYSGENRTAVLQLQFQVTCGNKHITRPAEAVCS